MQYQCNTTHTQQLPPPPCIILHPRSAGAQPTERSVLQSLHALHSLLSPELQTPTRADAERFLSTMVGRPGTPRVDAWRLVWRRWCPTLHFVSPTWGREVRLLELTRLLPGALMGAPVSPPPHGAGTVGSLVCCCFSGFFGVFGVFAGFSGFCGLIWVSLVFVVFSVFRGPQAGSNSRPVGKLYGLRHYGLFSF